MIILDTCRKQVIYFIMLVVQDDTL